MRNWIKKIKEKISEKKIDSSTEPENFSEKNIADTAKLKKINQENDGAPDKESNNVETAVKTNGFDGVEEVISKKQTPGWLNKLGENFKKTSSNIKKAIFAKKISKNDLDELQDALIMSDLGVSISEQLITDLKKKKIEDGKLKEEVVSFLEEQFNENDHNFVFKKKLTPQVILFFGVNGSGKTTTLAKLANKAKIKGLSTKMIAADTFRAAAVEQLQEWGNRLSLDVFTGKQNEDPSSVVFKGHKEALENNSDVVMIDTAGRLHNKTELMEELKKIVRIIQKNDPTAPHQKILVLDSTIGQNTYSQLEAFNSSIGITGVIMTKLDSSAKGGSLIGISKKYQTPIYFIGVGEKTDDLVDFNAKDFINALIGENFGEKNESLH